MSAYGRADYYADGLSESFDEHGIQASSEQIKAVAADVACYAENVGMAFYSPPAQDRYDQIERDWKAKFDALQREFDAYRGNAEMAVKKSLRQYKDANVSIGEHGEVFLHGGRTERIQ